MAFFIKEHLKFRYLCGNKVGKIILIALHKPKAFQISSFFETPYCYIIVILVTHQKPNITILIHLKQFLNRPWFGRKIIVAYLFNSLHLLWTIFGCIIDLACFLIDKFDNYGLSFFFKIKCCCHNYLNSINSLLFSLLLKYSMCALNCTACSLSVIVLVTSL